MVTKTAPEDVGQPLELAGGRAGAGSEPAMLLAGRCRAFWEGLRAQDADRSEESKAVLRRLPVERRTLPASARL